MNLAPIPEIKAQLRRNYPMFRFDMKAIPSEDSYQVIVYRGVDRLGDISMPANTPMTSFWEQIREWMLPFLRQQ